MKLAEMKRTEEMDSLGFNFWLATLIPAELVRLEMHYRRQSWDDRADACENAGVPNCGDEYYDI